jgi:3-phenylpropionate/trans-cinnamate dioxygenase ferredoxin subunit
VCALGELDDRKPFGAEVDGTPVVLVRDGERVYALRDECTHAEIPLSEGELTRDGIECWLHGSCFNLASGAPSAPPATEPVDTFAVSVVDGDVHVDVSAPTNN